MGAFGNPNAKLVQLERELQELRALVSARINPSGQVVQTSPGSGSTGFVGTVAPHDHSGIGTGGPVEYLPAIAANWNGDVDPGTLPQAVDQLAARLSNVEVLEFFIGLGEDPGGIAV